MIMSSYDLSILIPARNEQFLANTVEDLLKNKRGKTEILVGLDGQWADPGLPDHDDVRLVYYPESIGQRAMQNKLARISQAKYVMKLDAHCTVDEGFDVKMLEAFKGVDDDVTMVPLMKNLHAFDWKCMKCGNRWYQGATPVQCYVKEHEPNPNCDGDKFTQRIVFKPRHRSPNSTAYRFDKNLQFWYFSELKKHQGEGELVETMSLQGSCFMCTRENYWKKELCDETWGSWGQQGTEVAVKTWLSGGRVLCNKNTWYAHLFRTQEGFGFPYRQSGRSQQKAREISQNIFFNNKWQGQIYSLSWLLEKFWKPLMECNKNDQHWHGWTQQRLDELKRTPLPVKKGIIYYTDNRLDEVLARKVRNNIRHIARKKGMPIVSTSLRPLASMGKNIVLDLERGYLTMFKQILTALENSDSDIIFFCEHDVLYHPSHFDFTPPNKNKFYFNQNWWKIGKGDLAVRWDADQVSGLCCYRDTAIRHYRERIANFDPDNFDRKFEPMSGHGSESWKSELPNIDIRHENNLTYNKWTLDHFRKKESAVNFESSTIDKIPGWNRGQMV